MKCLSIECVTTKGEISICEYDHSIATVQLPVGNNHGKDIAPAINKLIQETKLKLRDIDAICVDSGPGSYTGIRVGISYSKAISMATGIPIYAASSLKAMALRFFQKQSKEQNVIVIMDAKWDELYIAKYSNSMKEISSPDIIRKDTLNSYLNNKDTSVIYNPENLSNIIGPVMKSQCIYPDAKSIAALALQEKLEPRPIYIRKIAPQIANSEQA